MSSAAVDLSPVQISFKPRARTASKGYAVRIALALPMIASVIAIAAFLFISIMRIAYPYELEWLESGIVEHSVRLAHGHSLYTAPNVSFTQLPYAPLTLVFGAALSAIFGVHFWELRALSIVSIIGVFAVLYYMVKRETQSASAGFIAAGLFAATYAVSRFWFDVAKPDSLFLFLTVAAVAMARRATTWRTAMIAAAVITLAVFAKQTAMFVFAPMAIYLVATKWRVGLTYIASTAVLLGVITLLLNAITHGWYNFFTWELLFQHEILKENEKLFFTQDLKPFWPVLLLVAAAAPQLLRRDKLWMTGFYSFAIAGMAAGSYTSRLHSGGAENVLMPAFAGAALAAGIALGTLLQKPKRVWFSVAAVAVVLMQFAFLRYDPTTHVPSQADKAAGDQFIGWLRAVPGDVWVVDHPTYALMAGKSSFASEGGMEDVLRGRTLHAKTALESSIAQAIHDQHFSAIILDGSEDARGFPADWQKYYEQMPGSAMPSDKAHPILNNTGIPRDVWVPVGTQVEMPAQ